MMHPSLDALMGHLESVIVGQSRMLRRLVSCLLAGGHCLLEGPPGVAKTLALRTLAEGLGGCFARIQFTPDLVPADIVGSRIWYPSTERFETELGPIMANLVLADEINRAPAKVQSALLEVMEEQRVTIAGRAHAVPLPFMVVATQNPIESTGTFELPEAQRDRFLMRIIMDHPSTDEEREILRRHNSARASGARNGCRTMFPAEELRRVQCTVATLPITDDAIDYALDLVAATRVDSGRIETPVAERLMVGASPRATLGLVAAARALAFLDGRSTAEVQDVYDVGFDVLNHRLVCSLDAYAEGDVPATVAIDLLRQVPARPAPIAVPTSKAGSR